MKTFGKIVLWIIGILFLLVIISYLLPKTYRVERSIGIKANQNLIYNLTSNLNKWELWTPWTKEMDSTVVFELIGPDGQVGTIRKWEGKIIGQGEMKILTLIPGELIEYDLSFQEGKYTSLGKIQVMSDSDSCIVKWSDEGDLGYNPITRYMGMFMDNMMGTEFEKGLKKLKEVAEARRHWPDIVEKELGSMTVLVIRDSAGPETYACVMGKAYSEIISLIQTQGLISNGAPFAIYLTWDSVTMRSTMDIGIPVKKAGKAKGRIRIEQIPAQQVVIANYYGPYDKTANTYYILDQYIRESGKTISGPPWEIYITDPMTEKDTMKWQTDILFPVN